jgi:hypothetical protein
MSLIKYMIAMCTSPLVWLAHAQPVLLEGNLDDWGHTSIVGRTIYQPMLDIDQGVIIRAQSSRTASSLNYDQTIDLSKTPILQWQWTAQTLPYSLNITDEGIEQKRVAFNERTAAGDDFVLRVIVSRTALFEDTKSLHYVWSANEAIGDYWSLDEHIRVLVVSGKEQTTMDWQTLTRHVQKDWTELFSEQIESIDRITIMTDSDAIQGHAVGYYGDIQVLADRPIASH